MPLSINKLVKLLVKRGFHPQSFYKIYGVCAFIEIISIRTADNYMLYIPSKYNFKVPPDYPNLYELKEIEVKSNDANTDILNEYGEKPNPLDVEKEYEEILLPNTKLFDEKEKVEQLLKEKYNKPIQITEANSGDNSDVKCIHRQMERLKFCVQNIDYKLVIIYKSYLAFLHTEDVIDMYYITDYDMKAFRNLLVTLDLEVLYNNASTDIELEQVKTGIEKVLDKNHLLHVRNLLNLINNKQSLVNHVNTVNTNKQNYSGYIAQFSRLLLVIGENENVLMRQIEELNRGKGDTLYGDIEYSHQKNKIIKEVHKLEKIKSELIRNIINLKNHSINISLTVDKILFDNTILMDSIFRNLESLSKLCQ
tara:strand:- start:4476 stop:5570 length:1095 start_codon:yes stop_codon:yes gene_type:complete